MAFPFIPNSRPQVNHNQQCDISGIYDFSNVPVDCQASELTDCPSSFSTNWQLNLVAPITCAEFERNVISSTGDNVLVNVVLRTPTTGLAQASYDAGTWLVCLCLKTRSRLSLMGRRKMFNHAKTFSGPRCTDSPGRHC